MENILLKLKGTRGQVPSPGFLKGRYSMYNYLLNHRIDTKTGNLHYLGFDDNQKQINFVGNPQDLSVIDNEGGELNVPGFGAVCLSYRAVDGEHAQTDKWIPFDTIDGRYVYRDESIVIEKSYTKKDNKFYIELMLKNLSGKVLEVDELSISVPVNNNYTEFRYEQEYLYNNRVYEHIYPGGTSGYQLVQRLNGEPPFMYLIPQGNTSFEHTAHYPGTTTQIRDGIPNFSWPGSSVIFLHAKGYLERNGFHAIMGKDSATSQQILPNTGVNYCIEAGFVGSIEKLKQEMVSQGKIYATAVPAMVSPIDTPIWLHIYSLGDVLIGKSSDYKIQEVKKIDNGFIYKIKFYRTGEHFIKVINDNGNNARLVFNIVLPLKGLIEKRAKFIIENQIYNCEGDRLDGAILPYSTRSFTGNGSVRFKKGQFYKEDSLWGNGSYEGGITEAMFLSQKNVLFPDGAQIAALETYTGRYIRRYLQNPLTNEVIWWCGDFFYSRAFDYMHLANFYYSMYLISARYNLTVKYTAKEYLYFAFQTLMKMYKASRPMDLVVGMMGGQGMFHILKSMQDEEMIAEYYELLENVNAHKRRIFSDNVPYGSECAYDNTGYECVVDFADRYNEVKWIRKMGDIILAAKGMQPVWWWNGSEIRWWDAEYDFSECCLHYTSPLNSKALFKAVSRGEVKADIEKLSVIYGGILGVFSKIHHDGSGSMSYCWEQESPNCGFHPFSGDIGLGLYGSLMSLGSLVYLSDNIGLSGYLCNVTEEQKKEMIVIEPIEGADRKISWLIEKRGEIINGGIEITTGKIKSIKLGKELNTINMEVAYELNLAHMTEIKVRCNAGYGSVLNVNGKKERFSNITEGYIRINYYINKETHVLSYCLLFNQNK